MGTSLQKQFAKFTFLLLLSALLTGFTFVLGAIPLRVIRRSFTRRAYWAGVSVLVISCFAFLSHPLALALAVLASLIGLYTDAEEAGSGFFAAGFFSSLTTSCFALVAAAFWSNRQKINLVQVAKENIAQVLTQVKSVNPQVNWTVDSMIAQVPSAFVIFLLASLAAALIWDRKLSRLVKIGFVERTTRSLLSFKVPDIFVWVSLVAVAAAFGQQKFILLQNISLNVVNVLGLLYFFQGIAVVKHFMTLNHFSRLWQTICFFFLLFQLFPLAVLVGFSDYWVSYRTRWTKKMRQGDRQYKSEN